MLKIEVEGVDGSGKTTGVKYLIERAKAKGLSVVETREVGNPHIPVCVKLRELVLDPNSGLSGQAMEFIFSAMRIENDIWLKNLQDSENPPDLVVSDRGWFSHLAYTDHNVTKDFTDLLYTGVMEQITAMPDVVVYFDVNTETALKRRIKRGTGMDVIEMKGVEYQELVRESFKERMATPLEAGTTPDIFVVDANDTIEGVREQLDDVLETLLARRGIKKAL